ncbi:unnamed protein product [Peniophora sp. CBMAI 1063]|nr:unnamed protein product [Peniophora sp. CBMAI 1063]
MTVAGNLPPEIWDEILVYQDARDLLRLRLLCRSMQDIIDSSSFAQYLIECFCAGVEDELRAGKPYAERLALLRERESAWRTMTPCRRQDVPLCFRPSGLYDITGGVFILGRNSVPEFMHTSGYSVFQLPSTGDANWQPQWRDLELKLDVLDFAVSVQEHDLNAVVTQQRFQGPPPVGQDIMITRAKFELHLRQFSSGEPHPEAAQPVITLREEGLIIHRTHTVVEIAGDLVVVLLFFPFMLNQRMDTIFVVNWKTGEMYRHTPFVPHQYKCFAFLDSHTLMLPNLQTFALDIYRIEPQPETGEMGLRHICVLGLPQRYPGVRLVSFQCRSKRNVHTRGSSDDTGLPPPTRPFRDSPEAAIVLLSMTFMYAPHSMTSMSMVVHRAALLNAANYALENGYDAREAVAYDFWGIRNTSWFDAPAAGWIAQSSGSKFVSLVQESSYAAIRVYDFNQHNVRRLQAQHGTERVRDGGNTVQVVNGTRKLDLRTWFRSPIEFGLAHVQSTLEEPCTADGVVVDEENILALTTDRSTYHIKTVEVLHFG